MKKSGFTLLELLFTLGVVCILILFSFSSLTQLKQKNEREFLINEITNAVSYAKMQARASGRTLYFFAKNHNSTWSEGIDLLAQAGTQDNILIHRWNWSLDNWNVEWHGLNGQRRINFSGNTHAMSNGQFVLTNLRTQEKIVLYLNKLGRVKQI